jgi:hypothetical protein
MKTAMTKASGRLDHLTAGIYRGIREGAFDIPSDFVKACGRKHLSLKQITEEFKTMTKQ